MSLDAIRAAAEEIIATDERFALDQADVRGTRFRVFRNAPSSLREMMQHSAQAHGDKTFLVYEDERWTYPEFCDLVNRTAHLLQSLGVQRGDRVAIAMRNYPELVTLLMAIPSIGAIAVPVNAWWTADELEYGFTDSGAKIAFADGPRHDRIASFAGSYGVRLIGVRDADGDESFDDMMARVTDTPWPDVPIDTDDDFSVMYSSGSTGYPKGVVQTHRGAISAVYSWVFAGALARHLADPSVGLPGEDIANGTSSVLVITPLFHVTATHPIWLQALVLGTSVVIMHKWDAHRAVEVINREKVTRFLGVPTQSADLLAAAKDTGVEMPSLIYVGSGGAKRPPAQVGELAEAFPNASIASGWGMTETNALGTGIGGPDYIARPGAAGRMIPPLQDFKIVDEQGAEVPPGEAGELVVRSPANMRCYLNKPDETAETLQDGWLKTGDLATVDEDGFYYIVDRKKNIIIRGGENISGLEVEAAIHRHPAVLEAGVFSVPDERLGEVVGAGITLRAGAELSSEHLKEFLSGAVAAFKIPQHVWFINDALPRGATDKIDRRALQKDCLDHLTAERALLADSDRKSA
ncbi:MAG: class I adenylate-forming enzyme family protein [Pseudomonadota bacterium]